MSFIIGFQGSDGILLAASINTDSVDDVVKDSKGETTMSSGIVTNPLIISNDGLYCQGVSGSGKDPSFLEYELNQVFGSTENLADVLKRGISPLRYSSAAYGLNEYILASDFNGSSLTSVFSRRENTFEKGSVKAIGPRNILSELNNFLPDNLRGKSLSELDVVAEDLMKKVEGNYNGKDISGCYRVHVKEKGIFVQNP